MGWLALLNTSIFPGLISLMAENRTRAGSTSATPNWRKLPAWVSRSQSLAVERLRPAVIRESPSS